jgi:hypothetical protein
MKDSLAWHLLWVCLAATVVPLAFQYLFDGRLDAGVLNYTLPACAASYMFGRQAGATERRNRRRGGAESD